MLILKFFQLIRIYNLFFRKISFPVLFRAKLARLYYLPGSFGSPVVPGTDILPANTGSSPSKKNRILIMM